ncbi:hypothetical protein RE0356_05260 [Prescottella equi]|nr:hypothetical protein RE0356_05260 [Prescottella equi]
MRRLQDDTAIHRIVEDVVARSGRTLWIDTIARTCLGGHQLDWVVQQITGKQHLDVATRYPHTQVPRRVPRRIDELDVPANFAPTVRELQ